MICRYCGVETGAGASHCSQAECIDALNAEIQRAKRLIGQARQPVTEPRGATADTQPVRGDEAVIEPA